MLGSPIEKRRAGLGTPVLRLMLNLRDPKDMIGDVALDIDMLGDQMSASTLRWWIGMVGMYNDGRDAREEGDKAKTNRICSRKPD